ncbi:conjugal transfer protein TraF [Psittacicella hinzii]|nr:conjugal transfer protein TraF [Psittacicella hinzii]
MQVISLASLVSVISQGQANPSAAANTQVITKANTVTNSNAVTSANTVNNGGNYGYTVPQSNYAGMQNWGYTLPNPYASLYPYAPMYPSVVSQPSTGHYLNSQGNFSSLAYPQAQGLAPPNLTAWQYQQWLWQQQVYQQQVQQQQHKQHLAAQGQRSLTAQAPRSLAVQVAYAPALHSNSIWQYGAQEQGWFYYNWDLEQELDGEVFPQPQLPHNPNPELVPQSTPEPTSTPKAVPPVPSNITVAWLQQHLPQYLERAMDQPTTENVLAYLYLQAYAQQKAWVFAEQAQMVSQGNPYLDNNAAFTVNASARQYREQLANQLRKKLFNLHADKFVLLMVISGDFESKNFAELISMAVKNYGVKLGIFDIQGRVYAGLEQHMQQLPVAKVLEFVQQQQTPIFPTLYVVDKEKTQVLVAGATDLVDLEARLMRYLYSAGLVTRVEFNMARGIMAEAMYDSAQLSQVVNQKLGFITPAEIPTAKQQGAVTRDK